MKKTGKQVLGIYIRVSDLNADDIRRNQILAGDPDWLRDKNAADKERYLRMRVVINVYDKFKFEILEPKAVVCMTVTDKN